MRVLGFGEKLVTPQKSVWVCFRGFYVTFCDILPLQGSLGQGLDGMGGHRVSPVPSVTLLPQPKSP